MSKEQFGDFDMPQVSGVVDNTVSLEERKVKALEKIAYNIEVVADAVDLLSSSDWGSRLEYYLYLTKENYLPDVKDKDA